MIMLDEGCTRDEGAGFSGSYAASDVTFLLTRISLETTPVARKEALIQSGAAHYSEMISEEQRPDARYLALFRDARQKGDARIAHDVLRIAAEIERRVKSGALPPEITLCSLVRAGAPYGVLLNRELAARSVDVVHFGVSVIRDRGLDENAMAYVMSRRPVGGVLFVDGWTGKGAISGELSRSWTRISGREPQLVVLADPAGFASLSGSHEDWLIPSGILGANVSGLISRSVLNRDLLLPGQFHGYVPVDHLSDLDVSRAFVDDVFRVCEKTRHDVVSATPDPDYLAHLRDGCHACIKGISETFSVDNLNRVKPGIAEATRAVLRRKPERVLVRSDAEDPDLAPLLHLCERDGVEVEQAPDLTGPYRAVTLIGKV